MSLNKTAQAWKDAADARKRKARVRERVRAALWIVGGIMIVSCAIAWALISAFSPTTPQPLPSPDQYVVAFRPSGHWYKAYVDPNGDFHNAEDGTYLGTVTHWIDPNTLNNEQ